MKYPRLSPWVSWGLVANFLIAIISGLVVSYPYKESLPLVSTVGIETVVPLGHFFRALHYFSGQLCLIFLLVHTWETLLCKRESLRPWWAWTGLVWCLVGLITILFTGYIIRGDQTGAAAGHIAEHLMNTIPFIGKPFNHFFFLLSKDGVHRPWLVHVYLSWLILFFTSLFHFRIKGLKIEDLAFWGIVCSGFSLLFPASLEAPKEILLLKGPWFFLGVQEALRYLPPLGAGIIFPGISIGALWASYWYREKSLLILKIWIFLYALLNLIGWLR